MTTEIVLTEQTAVEIYNGGLNAVLDKIAKDARSEVIDISTETGRKSCASLAYKIARSKTLIDDTGKKLGDDARKKIDSINADRKKARDFLDSLKDEVRRPLTDWEQADAKRVDAHESALAEIVQAGTHTAGNWATLPVDAMNDRLKEIESSVRNWEEFSQRAKQAISAAAAQIRSAIQQRTTRDAEQAELARLRKEEEDRKKRERDESIARQAAENARIEAERVAADKARRVAETEEKRRIEVEQKAQAENNAAKAKADRAAELAEKSLRAAEQKAQAEALKAEETRLSILRSKQEAEDRAAAAEARLVREAAEAEEAAKRAAEKAERDKAAAVESERARLSAEVRAKAITDAKLSSDKKHQAKVNNEVLSALMKVGVDESLGKILIGYMAKGTIPHVKIVY